MKRVLAEDECSIGSKGGYTHTTDWQINLPKGEKHEIKEHVLPVLRPQINESKGFLGDHLDLYQIHSNILDSGVIVDEAVPQEPVQLRNSGLNIGFSVSGTQQADTIRKTSDIEFDGLRLFSVVQAT